MAAGTEFRLIVPMPAHTRVSIWITRCEDGVEWLIAALLYPFQDWGQGAWESTCVMPGSTVAIAEGSSSEKSNLSSGFNRFAKHFHHVALPVDGFHQGHEKLIGDFSWKKRWNDFKVAFMASQGANVSGILHRH